MSTHWNKQRMAFKPRKNFAHVYPLSEESWHTMIDGAHCRCEPEIRNEGIGRDGSPLRIFVHQRMSERMKNFEVVTPKTEYKGRLYGRN